MNVSSSEKAPKKPERSRARNCMLLNLAATPGLGSLLAGRLVEGIGQLIIALVGFVLFTIWIIRIFAEYYGQISGNVDVKPIGWIGLTGGLLFAAAWVWSLVTSLSVNREEHKKVIEELNRPFSPPKI